MKYATGFQIDCTSYKTAAFPTRGTCKDFKVLCVELFLNIFECLRYFVLENGSELSSVFKQAVQRHIETICITQKAQNERNSQ